MFCSCHAGPFPWCSCGKCASSVPGQEIDPRPYPSCQTLYTMGWEPGPVPPVRLFTPWGGSQALSLLSDSLHHGVGARPCPSCQTLYTMGWDPGPVPPVRLFTPWGGSQALSLLSDSLCHGVGSRPCPSYQTLYTMGWEPGLVSII